MATRSIPEANEVATCGNINNQMKEYSLEIPPQELAIEALPMDFLGEADQKRVLDFITYNGKFDPGLITKAVGRNILFPLLEPIISLDTVQVSGAGYFDFGLVNNDGQQAVLIPNSVRSPIRPPQKDAPLFTHTTTIVSGGKTISLVRRSPLGAYTEQAAKEKFANSVQAFRLVNNTPNCPFLVPLPITSIQYPDIPDGRGGKQSALVWACPVKGLRAEDLISQLLNRATANPDKKQQEAIAVKKFAADFLPLFHAMGRSARFLHHQGFCHYQMTHGNVSPLLKDRHGKPKICLYDWETLLPTDATNPLLARAYDMSAALGSNSAVLELIANQIELSPESLVFLGYNSFLHFLSGYTNENSNNVHSRLKLTQDEVFQSFLSPRQILTLLIDVVLPRIDDLSPESSGPTS